MISNEIEDEDEDDDAATHVIASRDVLGSAELAELAESDFAPPRRAAPPPVPSRIPGAQPPAVRVQQAWADEGEYDETLNYGEGQSHPNEDDVPTRMPPQTAAKFHPQFSPLQPPVAPAGGAVFRPSAPVQSPIYEPPPQNPYERTAVSADAAGGPSEGGPDLGTKLLLLLIVLLAAALAVVLVLIARR